MSLLQRLQWQSPASLERQQRAVTDGMQGQLPTAASSLCNKGLCSTCLQQNACKALLSVQQTTQKWHVQQAWLLPGNSAPKGLTCRQDSVPKHLNLHAAHST